VRPHPAGVWIDCESCIQTTQRRLANAALALWPDLIGHDRAVDFAGKARIHGVRCLVWNARPSANGSANSSPIRPIGREWSRSGPIPWDLPGRRSSVCSRRWQQAHSLMRTYTASPRSTDFRPGAGAATSGRPGRREQAGATPWRDLGDRCPEIFAGGEILTTAILDRLLHHAHIVHTNGLSYRPRELDGLLQLQTPGPGRAWPHRGRFRQDDGP